MSRSARPIIIAALIAAVAVAVIAFAASAATSGGGRPDAGTLIGRTFSTGRTVKSAHLDATLALIPRSGPRTTLSLGGPFQSRGADAMPAYDMTLVTAGQGRQISLGMISTGTQGFLTVNDTPYAMSDAQYRQFQQGYASGGAGGRGGANLAQFGVDPRRWLTGAKVTGTRTVGGVTTTHITAGVNVPRMITDLNGVVGKAQSSGVAAGQQQLSSAQAKQLADAIRGVRVDIDTGTKDAVLRRMRVTMDVRLPDGQQIAGLGQGTVVLDLVLTEVGRPQMITAPANARPYTELQRQLTTALGAVARSTTGGAGGAQGLVPSGSPTTGGSSRYLACLQAAGPDLAKAQRCAALVGR